MTQNWDRNGPEYNFADKAAFVSPLRKQTAEEIINEPVDQMVASWANADQAYLDARTCERLARKSENARPKAYLILSADLGYDKTLASARDRTKDHNICGYNPLTKRFEKKCGPVNRQDDQSHWVIKWLYREVVPRHSRADNTAKVDRGSLLEKVRVYSNDGKTPTKEFLRLMEAELGAQRAWIDRDKDTRTNDQLRYDLSLTAQTDVQITAAFLIRQKMEEDQAEVRAAKAGKWPNWLPAKERFNHKVTYVGPIPPSFSWSADIQPHIACATDPPGTQQTNVIGKEAAERALKDLEDTGATILSFRCVTSEHRVPTAGQAKRAQEALANLGNTKGGQALSTGWYEGTDGTPGRNGGPSRFATAPVRKPADRQWLWKTPQAVADAKAPFSYEDGTMYGLQVDKRAEESWVRPEEATMGRGGDWTEDEWALYEAGRRRRGVAPSIGAIRGHVTNEQRKADEKLRKLMGK